MTALRRVTSNSGRFTLTVYAAPPLPLVRNFRQHRLLATTRPGVHCRARRAFQYHGRVVWQTGGPSLFADVTASYHPLDSPTLTLAIANDFFPEWNNETVAETWLRVLANATYVGAGAVLEKRPPVCGGTLFYSGGRYHPVDSNQLAYYRLGRVIAFTALADHRTLTDEQICSALGGV